MDTEFEVHRDGFSGRPFCWGPVEGRHAPIPCYDLDQGGS